MLVHKQNNLIELSSNNDGGTQFYCCSGSIRSTTTNTTINDNTTATATTIAATTTTVLHDSYSTVLHLHTHGEDEIFETHLQNGSYAFQLMKLERRFKHITTITFYNIQYNLKLGECCAGRASGRAARFIFYCIYT